ncbi:GDNF family receptor alpha-3 [Melanerpes formicivorus]|uniref:GDNF family receptor alpha-3 n=1 Tax=Melanerpes formicivorus TaxID=211600 RepID=UPI00358E8CB5
MGLSLFLGLLLFRAGALLAPPRSDCIAAEQLCLSNSTCNATYRTLEQCALAKTRVLPLDHDSRVRCLNAELDLGNSSLLHCKCQRRMKRQEHCLRVFWTVHASMADGYFNLETSPYENSANEEHWKTDYNKVAAVLSGSRLAGDATNPCLKATHICNLSKKCVRHRTDYASICTRGAGSEDMCDRRKCHKGLRNFFEKVPEDFTKRILFCPCQDELCGERRRKTIVPECSFHYNTKPNCLWLLDSCLEDHICKSRLADFQQNCQPTDMSPDGCSQHNHAACLQAYMGLIGTPMTPNYISNSSVDISLWCTCESSGNQKEKCDQILGMFESNKCLENTILSQMHLKKEAPERLEDLLYSSSISFQGDSASTSLASEMSQVDEGKTQRDISEHSSMPMASSVYSGAAASWPSLVLFLPLLLSSH